jgi:tetratricopeptide (TPR) repeat protein
MRRRRLLLAVPVVLLVLCGLGSVRRLETPGRWYVVDFPVLQLPARLAQPGWRFVPLLLGRVSEYPAGPARLKVDLSGERAAASREGARLDVEVDLTYDVPADRVLDLHRARGPAYEAAWLAERVRRAAAERLAQSPYDQVRDRDPELARSLRLALAGEAGKDGLQVTALRIVQIAGAGETSGAIRRIEAPPVERRVVVIGVDSFDWRILEPLTRQGRMPNVARLIARGARAQLRTIRPILSPVIWTSIATGVKPSRHGIVDFVVTSRDSGALMPVTSAMRQVPALWTLLGRQGIDVGVVAWWATWPAETVRGSIVTDRVAYQLFEESIKVDWKTADPARNRGKTFPPELIDDLRPLIVLPSEVGDDEVAPFLGSGEAGGRLPATLAPAQHELIDSFRTVLAAGRTYHAIALRLFAGDGPGLRMVYYEGPDTTSHLFMRYRPPILPGVAREDLEQFGGVVDRYYVLQDRYIGEIVEQAGPGATVILVSDHGFKSDESRPPHSDPRIGKGDAADWHSPVGVFVAAGPGIRGGVDLGAASVLDVTPTVLALYGLPVARDMDGQPLTEALDPAFLKERPVAWIDSYGGFRSLDQDDGAIASGEDAEMIEKLRALGYIGEDRLTAHNNRGVMALDEGEVDEAIADFERALPTAPSPGGGAMVRTNLARAWLQKGDLDKAARFASEALSADPRNKQAESLLAAVAIKRGDLSEGERRLGRALAIDPSFVQARSQLARLRLQRGEDEAALVELRRVVAVAPLSPVEYNNIGNIHRKRGQIDLAMEAYREALRCDAQYIGAYNNLGLCLQERGRLDEARALYDKALAIRPENPVLRNSMGTLLALRGHKEEAVAEFERAVKADPDWPVAQGNLATILFEVGRFDEARAAFERWVALEDTSVEPRLGLGLSLLMLGKRDEAASQFEQVLRRDSRNLRAHIALGETYLRAGDLDRARAHLETAARLDSSVPRVFNSLGEVYLGLGLKRQAAQVLRRSLAIDPRQDPVRLRLSEIGG